MKPWERFSDMVTAAEEAGHERAQHLVREGRMPTLYLYYKKAGGQGRGFDHVRRFRHGARRMDACDQRGAAMQFVLRSVLGMD